jgi:hypothetical protein
MTKPTLALLAGDYAIHRFTAADGIPPAVLDTPFVSITRTADELSIVCPDSIKLESSRCDSGWACFRVAGTLDFSLTGILADLAGVLARDAISLFAVSTFDTDYILVKKETLAPAVRALSAAGYRFDSGQE